MSSETFTYNGISAGKYLDGDIEARHPDEESYKLTEQQLIITNIANTTKTNT